MRILVTGAGGLLGGRLARLLSADHVVTGVIRSQAAPDGIATTRVDLNDAGAAELALRAARPDAVIHCAARGDAEVCERNPELAHRENVLVTRTLAEACRREGSRLVTVSTDLVFGGDLAFSNEDVRPRPLTEYGRTKLAGEAAALEACPDATVLRVSLVCGLGHGSRQTGSETIAQRLQRGEPVTLYHDEWRTPLDPESIAAAILALLARPHVRGRFHLAGGERLSRAELGLRVAAAFHLDPSLIKAAPQSSHRGAPRPRDVSLDITRAREELGWTPRPLDAAIREGRLD